MYVFISLLLQLSNRVRNEVERKKRLVSALKANVSEEAQNLYMSLSKVVSSEQVSWNGPEIMVFNEVVIRPPYKPENVEANTHGKQREVEYVRKLVSNRLEQINNISSNSAASTVSFSTPGV